MKNFRHFYLFFFIIYSADSLGRIFDQKEMLYVSSSGMAEVNFQSIYKNTSDFQPSVGRYSGLSNALEPLFSSIFKFIGDVFSGLFDLIGTIFKGLGDGISWVFSKIGDGFTWVFESISNVVARAISSSSDTIKNILDAPDSNFTASRQMIDELDGGLLKQSELENNPQLEVFVSIPTGASDYSKIFLNDTPSASEIAEIKFMRERFSEFPKNHPDIVTRSTEGSSINNFEEAIVASNSKYFVIIGHNDNNGFRFLDGDAVSLAKMGAICASLNKSCIFLSCKSAKNIDNTTSSNIGLQYDLGYQDVGKILDKLAISFINYKHISAESIQIELEKVVKNAELSVKIEPKVKFLIVSAPSGFVLAGVIVEMEEQRNE